MLRLIIILCYALTFSVLSQDSHLLPITNNPVYNGTLFIIQSKEPTPITSSQNPTKQILWHTHPTDSTKYIAFIPISYHQKDNITLYLQDIQTQEPQIPLGIIPITQKPYKQEQISVPPSKVTYDKKIAKRIENERKQAVKIYKNITPKRYWSKPFIRPLDSVITSAYGNSRIFNGVLQSFHTGTDFRAALKTPIKASNDGKVVLAQDRYLAGKSIIIDHGEGVYSVYFHLDSFKVKVNDIIKRGQVIALSGNTGRSNGAHLHFGIVLYGTIIDPIDFIEQIQLLFSS